MDYLNAVCEFVFCGKPLHDIDYSMPCLVFTGVSALVALVFISVCYIFDKNNWSRLVKYTFQTPLEIFISISGWVIGAAIVSFIGFSLHIFGDTIQSCVIIILSWMTVANQIRRQGSFSV